MLKNSAIFFWKKKTQIIFFIFHFQQLCIVSIWMPWSMSTLHNVLLGRFFHKTADYTDSAIACSTAGNVNYFPQQNFVH